MGAFENFQLRAIQARGAIIDLSTLIESILNGILSKYFCKDDKHQQEMVEPIFGTERFSLRGKYHLLIDLLKRKCVDDEYATKFKGLQNRFDEFVAVRNKFAHDQIILPGFPDAFYDKYQICLIRMKGSIEYKCYDNNDLNEIIQNIEILRNELMTTITDKILGNG